MAQGGGNAHAAAMLLLILGLQSCGLWHSASAATHTVGGSQRWDIGIDYTNWAAGQTFKLGDILFFSYSAEQHNLVVVDKAGYDACSDANAIATFENGNTNVTLSATGTHYYLCSIVGHCAAGMKLAVTVSAAAAPTPTPPPVPTASPSTSAPSPSKTPSSSPSTAPSSSTSTPVPSPSPSSSPSPSPSSPVPTPSAEAPASAPTPSSPAPVPTTGPAAPSPGSAGSTPPGPPSPGTPPNSAPSFLSSAAIAPLVALLVAFTV